MMTIVWNPDPFFFTLPILGRPIAWYGILFALGFFLGYRLVRWMARSYVGDEAGRYTDRLLWFTLAGTIIGARLGHVFFYEWPYYRQHLGQIIAVWQGGLASHGAAVGIFASLGLFHLVMRKKHPEVSFLKLLDMVCIVTVFIAPFIRVGNFINQELVGNVTDVPWGVIFGRVGDGLARHPVQLYEALAYGLIFLQLLFLRRFKMDGLAAGYFFIMVFSARFFLEMFKAPLSALLQANSLLSMGQLLSIPFIGAGFVLFFYCLFKAPEERNYEL